jgi:hypothetical protein
VDAPLQLLKARTTGLVEGDQLSVEDGLAPAQRLSQAGRLRELGAYVAPGSALQRDRAVDVGQCPHAVPLDLESITVLVGGHRREAGQHRPQVARHRLPLSPRHG